MESFIARRDLLYIEVQLRARENARIHVVRSWQVKILDEQCGEREKLFNILSVGWRRLIPLHMELIRCVRRQKM